MIKEINILLIEDNPADAKLIDIYLGDAFKDSYSVDTSARLSEALLLLSVRKYDVVLCDLSLPDSQGIDTFVKVFQASPEIPVIVLTGYGDDAFAANAVAQGAADFLGKNNLDSNLLRRSVVYSIERNNLQRQLWKMEELQKAKELAERTTKERKDFLSVMSHEIRTPLNAIIGVTNLLIEEDPSPRQKDHLNILQFSTQNLLVLVNNVLDFSRIEAGKIQLEKVAIRLRDLVSRVSDSISHLAKDKRIRLNVNIEKDLPEVVIGDPNRLTQVLNNLLHNALKFTEKGEVTLKITSIPTDRFTAADPHHNHNEIEVLFEVSDTGIGIAHDRLDSIFESFAQAHSSTARIYGGTGLGLTICKQLVKLMGGYLMVESELRKGSAFRFNVPLLIGTKEQVIEDVSPGDALGAVNRQNLLKGIRILVVEDNPTGRMLIGKFLIRWGAAVDTAGSGEEAVEKVKTNGGQFDLVLMDIQMPGIDGYEANRQIRNMGFTVEQLPIIALTASVMDEDKKRVLESGMNDHIPKPIDLGELYAKIIKNIPDSSLTVHSAFFDPASEGTEKHILTLQELLDNFQDDTFRQEYIRLYKQEFKEFPNKISTAVRDNDMVSFSQCVHKITPNIQRIAEGDLPNQLSHLKTLISARTNANGKAERNNSEDIETEIESVLKEVDNSCISICDRIRDIENEYFWTSKKQNHSAL